MNRDEFERQLAMWTAELTMEAKRLYDTGCAPEQCLKIAGQIADSRLVQDARGRQVVTAPPSAFPRR